MPKQFPLFKSCSRCGELKAATTDFFPRVKKVASGIGTICKVCMSANSREWAKQNPDRTKAAWKRHHETHRVERNAYSREYSRAHKRKMAEKQKRFRQSHPEKGREYYSKNPERFRRKQRVTNNRRRAAEGTFSVADTRWQYQRQRGLCFWCGTSIDFNEMHLDHIIPVTRFGTNWIANIVCSCVTCNLQKGAKLPFVEWQPPNCIGR